MAHWIRICDIENGPPVGRGWTYETEAGQIALFNVDGTFYAIEGECPHQSAALGMGELNGAIVTCPGHGLRYNVITGLTPGSANGVRSFSVEVRPDGVYADLEPVPR